MEPGGSAGQRMVEDGQQENIAEEIADGQDLNLSSSIEKARDQDSTRQSAVPDVTSEQHQHSSGSHQPQASTSQLPRHESIGSFTTAPEQVYYRNSSASLGAVAQRNAGLNGSSSMAQIAEVSEDSANTPSATSTPAQPLATRQSRLIAETSGDPSNGNEAAGAAAQGDTAVQNTSWTQDIPSTRIQSPSAPASRQASRRTSLINGQDQSTYSAGGQSPRLASSRSSPQLLSDTRSVRSIERTARNSPTLQKSRSSGAESSAGSSSHHNQLRTQERKRSSKEAVPPLPRSSSFYAQSQSGSYQNLATSATQQDTSSNSLPPGAMMAPSKQPFPSHSPMMQNQPMYNNRISAPLLSSPPAGNPYGGYGAESVYTASPSPIFDAGFGASSPYPPITGSTSHTQRFSFPTSAMGPPGSRSQASLAAQVPNHRNSSSASLRPQPTMQSGASRHLPEMHPSALEARPSQSAPFPPSSSPPRGYRKDGTAVLGVVAPAAVQQRERPDASRPLGQEICLECLMRDRDMADVEVTGPGIWSRTSDLDFEEALRAEESAIKQYAAQGGYAASSLEDGGGGRGASSTDENFYMPGAMHNGRHISREALPRAPSRESSLSDGPSRPHKRLTGPQRIIGGGQPLLATSLKLWTSMVSCLSGL